MKTLIIALASLLFCCAVQAQDMPPIIVPPTEAPKPATDWVQLAVTIGGFLVTIVGMILNYLKSRDAAEKANVALKQSQQNAENITQGRVEAKTDVELQTKHLIDNAIQPLLNRQTPPAS